MDPCTSTAGSVDQSIVDDHMEDWLFVPDFEQPQGPDKIQTEQETEDRGKLKTKLVSAWNNVKYGWSLKQKSHFSKTAPVFMFGHPYLLIDQADRGHFRRSFTSLLWLTYRRGFPKLEGCSLTTDSGWGCILRSGQMLLAQGLLLHMMPPDWTWPSSHPSVKDDMDLPEVSPTTSTDSRLSFVAGQQKKGRKLSLASLGDSRIESKHRRVVSLFADHPSAPFGIHQLVEFGKSSGVKAGDWYGPAIMAHILRKAVAASNDVGNLVVYVAPDCTIYTEDVRKLCECSLSGSSSAVSQSWKSVIILVPVRLGGQHLNRAYITCVKKLLMLQCCIGIIGGKPKHSLFFVGFQGDNVLYLDPHYCQPAVDVRQKNFPLESFHCKYPRKMPFSRMDPSCTIGFFAEGQKDFEALRIVVNEALSVCGETYPMFTFADGVGWEDAMVSCSPTNNIVHIQRNDRLRKSDSNNSMDEFVLL